MVSCVTQLLCTWIINRRSLWWLCLNSCSASTRSHSSSAIAGAHGWALKCLFLEIQLHEKLAPQTNSSVQSSKANQPLHTCSKVLKEEVLVAMLPVPCSEPLWWLASQSWHCPVLVALWQPSAAPGWQSLPGHQPQLPLREVKSVRVNERRGLGSSFSCYFPNEQADGYLSWFRVNALSAVSFRCFVALPLSPIRRRCSPGLESVWLPILWVLMLKWETYLLYLEVESWARRCIFVMQISPLFSVIFHHRTDKS